MLLRADEQDRADEGDREGEDQQDPGDPRHTRETPGQGEPPSLTPWCGCCHRACKPGRVELGRAGLDVATERVAEAGLERVVLSHR